MMKKNVIAILVLVAAVLVGSFSSCAASERIEDGNWYWIYSDQNRNVYIDLNKGMRAPNGEIFVVKKTTYLDGREMYGVFKMKDEIAENTYSISIGDYLEKDSDGNILDMGSMEYRATGHYYKDSVPGIIAAKIIAMY